MEGSRTIRFEVPGAAVPLLCERDENGRLERLTGGDRIYLDARTLRRVDYDGGFVVVESTELPGGLLRRVRALGRSWTEAYRWDAKGQLIEVDGVHVSYDSQGRIVCCSGPAGNWHYGYSGAALTVIHTPRGIRHVLRGEDGRASGWRENGRTEYFNYDGEGRRLPRRRAPRNWNFDGLGRLWTITDDAGRVLLTYLWDGRHCLGAIAGEPGEPLASVYSLDPTGTPVRVITRDQVRQVPRDAFGEALLDIPGVPGLFGGAVRDGFVHLPYRRLDPRTGSFDDPDPMNGEKTDPRRAAGWTGPLPIELPVSGPYTVCRNNPVSLADPTGAISELWWLIPSALTWSIQNTLGSLLGMWFNLEFSPLGWIISAAAKANPFDVEWISAKNFGSFGLRADGWISRIQPVAWTFQFLVNEEGSSFTALQDARVFAPAAGQTFRPSLYGSVLRCVPANANPFLIRGQRSVANGTALPDWSRCGGDAEPAIPGSQMPVFPNGGIHFDTVQRGVRKQNGEIVEIEPAGATLFGTLSTRAFLIAPGTSTGLNVNDNVALVDGAGVVEVTRVVLVNPGVSTTSITVDTDLTRLAASGIHLDGLTGPAGTENLTPVASNNRLLSVTGSSNDYQPTLSVLRLSRGGTPVHFAKVDALEARLSLDSALPASLGASLRVRPALASGNFDGKVGATPTVFDIVAGTAPGVGTGVALGLAPNQIPAIVQSVAGQSVTVDRDISALGAANTPIKWANLAPSPAIGRRDSAPEAEARITYVPDSPGTAPSSGFVWIEGSGIAVRRITGLDYDALVMSQARPDASPDAYSVDRFRIAAPSIGGLSRTQSQILALNAAPPPSTRAFHVLQLTGATVTAGANILGGANVNGSAAVSSVNPASPPAGLQAGQVIVVTPTGGSALPAVIQRLRLTVTFDRNLTLNASGQEAALLGRDIFAYTAERRADRTVRVRPDVSGTRVDMPRFSPGELVAVDFTDGGNQVRLVRITSVNGTTITYAADADVIPATASNLTVTRLIVQDPGTGSARLGIDGTRIAANQIEFSAWNASDFPNGRLLAILDAGVVYAVSVANAAQPLTIQLGMPAGLTGPLTLSAALVANSGFSSSFTVEGAVLTFLDSPIGTIGPGLVVAVPYIDTTRRVSGEFHPGNVRVPKDHENTSLELDRRQSLEDHELTHTLQSARLGPLMLVIFPVWALELASDLTAAGGPEFSPYTAATLAAGRLNIAAAGFEAAQKVQVAQNGRAVLVELGASGTGGFALSDSARNSLTSAGMRDGPVQVRRQLTSTGSDVLEWITNILQLLSLGGMLNVLSIAGWGGIAALITQIVQWIRQAARSTVTASVGDDHRTLTIAAGKSLDGLRAGSNISVKSGDQLFIRPVDSVSGQTVVLREAVPLSGNVEIGLYSPGSALFGGPRSYYPATVPDANQPARLQLQSVNGDRLSLAVHDRIEIRSASGTSYRTLVTAASGDTVEVETATLLPSGAPNEFLVSKIGEQDPSGWLDQWLLNELGIGWMQYLHDPYGQILYRAQPTTLAGQIAARSARYLFGTQSWACIFLGFFWNDNAYRRANAHRSRMEQEASHNSGDTYCPLGSLHGDVPVIGDIARYWMTVSGGTRDGYSNTPNTPADLINFGLQDAPGVNLADVPTLIPAGGADLTVSNAAFAGGTATVTTSAAHRLNVGMSVRISGVGGLGGFNGVQVIANTPTPTTFTFTGSFSGGYTSGGTVTPVQNFAVPRDLYQVNRTGAFTTIGPRGWVPLPARLERSAGIHVAFTRTPGAGNQYTITSQPSGNVSTGQIDDANDAQANGAATISFSRTPGDVAVTVATLAAAEGATIDLLPFQRAAIAVTPNGNRVYRTTVTEPGATFDIDGQDLVAKGVLATDDLEISRFHRFNAASNSFDSGIGPIHLPSDIHLAVRRLQARVVNQVPLRAAMDPAAAAVASVRAGDSGFILVPSHLAPSPIGTAVTGTPALTPAINPAANVPAAAQAYIRDGAALQVQFPADQPPEGAANLTITIPVGPDAASAVPVTCQVAVNPHFTLDNPGGFQVARGASIVLQASDGTTLQSATTIAGITVTPNNAHITVQVDAGTSLNSAVILVRDAANAQRMARRTITIV
jgi:hypothetical protein